MTPVSMTPAGAGCGGVGRCVAVQPLVVLPDGGGAISQMSAAPHHNRSFTRDGSYSRPQFWMSMLRADSHVCRLAIDAFTCTFLS